MRLFVRLLILWPEQIARYLAPLGPLAARIVTGWVFLWSGWGKLQALPLVTENFVGWGIPAPAIMAPLVSGLEFVCGAFLLAGFLTRIAAGALGVTMIVAIKAAKWDDVDSLVTLLGFDEMAYLAMFFWLAIAGPGKIAVDEALRRRFGGAAPL